MIQFTDKAIVQVAAVLEGEEILRVAVRGGGCSGMTYGLDIETKYDEEDIQLDIPGIQVCVDPHSAEILKNTTVDYVTTLQQQGFTFLNPDANTTCGCGSSFS